MALPRIVRAPSQVSLQLDHAETRPPLASRSRQHSQMGESSPEEQIKWQIAGEIASCSTGDELLSGKGIGDYALAQGPDALLGKGKFSSVHLASKGDTRYAVKHTPLHPHHEQIATRLLREAHILAQLPRHPNLVKAFETIRTPGHFYLVEEYLEGYVNLETFVQSMPDKRVDARLAGRILDQLVSVVRNALHSPIRIAHRDIKPENVVIHPETEHIVLLDLGLSTHFSHSEAKLTTVCGSPAFWSPELWLSNHWQQTRHREILKYWGPEVDIWCIGVTLLRLLRGKRFPLGAAHSSLEELERKVKTVLESIEDDELRDKLAPLLHIDSKKRMEAFAAFEIASADPPSSSEYEFKSTSFLVCEPTHALALPMLDPQSPRIPRRVQASRSPSRSRRTSPSGRLSRPISRASSRASSPARVTSLDGLVALGASELDILPPAPLVLAFGNPEAHTVRRAFSFFKYALRCAGILYRVVSVKNPPALTSLSAPSSYAILLHCVALLSPQLSAAQHTLQVVLQSRPRLDRSQSARSQSLPPKATEGAKQKQLFLPFYLGISTATSEAFEPPRSPLMDTDRPLPRRSRQKSGRKSRATSPGAPECFVVHLSDKRAYDLVSNALSVGTLVEQESPPVDRGRRSSRQEDDLSLKMNGLGLSQGQDPLASPALPSARLPSVDSGKKDYFSRWKGRSTDGISAALGAIETIIRGDSIRVVMLAFSILSVLLCAFQVVKALPEGVGRFQAPSLFERSSSLEARQQAASSQNDFFWSYSGTASNTTLRQCGQVSVTWGGGPGTTGNMVAPFYLVAIPVGGTPTQIPLGSGNSGTFTLPFRQGTQFTMAVVDSQGHQGGFVGLLNVIEGNTDSCIQVPSSPVLLGLNTTNIPVCDYLGIQLTGGTAPYTVTIVPAGSIATTTNTTLGANDNYYGWVAARNTGTRLLVAARDSAGNWAPTSSIVFVTGTNAALPSCNGLQDIQSNGPPSSNAGASASISATPTAVGGGVTASSSAPSSSGTSSGSRGNQSGGTSSTGGSSSNAGAIAGGVVGGIVGLALILLLAFCLWRRKKRAAGASGGQSTMAYVSRPAIEPEMSHVEAAHAARVTPFDLSESSSSPRQSGNYYMPAAAGMRGGSSQPSGSRAGDSSIVASAGHDVPAGGFRLANPDHDQLAPPLMGSSEGSSSEEKGGTPSSDDSQRPVIQHQDAGPVRQHDHDEPYELPSEIPPSYMSRGPSGSGRRQQQ